MEGALSRTFTAPKARNVAPQLSLLQQSLASSQDNFPKHVVIFMDASEEFSIEPLEWVLKNVIFKPCCKLSIIGISPYLNIPLYLKTSTGIWSVDREDLHQVKEKREGRIDPKYQKVQYLMDLCETYGVVPEIRTEMGHPLRRRVLELITSLQATLVVFDKYHDRKNIEYYAERVPYIMVIMNEDEEVDMIKGRSQINSTSAPEESPHSLPPAPKVMISKPLKKFLWPVYRRLMV